MEVMIVIGLIIIITVSTIPPSLRFFNERKFEEQSDAVISALTTARDQSIASKDGMTFGVKFLSNTYVIFEGATYANRIVAKDETFPLSGGTTINQDGVYPDELAFTESGAIAAGVTTTVEIKKGTLLRTVIFNKLGAKTTTPVVDTTNLPPEAVGTLDAYWKFDEITGTRYDSTGNFDLVKRDVMNLASGTGKINKAAQLGNYGQVRNIDGEIGNANRDFTVAGWLNISSLDTTAYLMMGIKDQTDSMTWMVAYDAPYQKFRFSIANTQPVFSLITPTTDTWYFIAASYNKATQQVSLRVNNGPVNTITITGTPPNGAGILVGGAGSARIDEAGIWSKVLEDDELATLYNDGAGTTTPFTGTLGVKTGPFASGSPADLPPVDCGWLHTKTILYPLSVQNATATPNIAWSSSTAALAKDGDGAIALNTGSTSTISQTLQFRNFKDASSTPPYSAADAIAYNIDKIAIDIHTLSGFNTQDSSVRIIHSATSSTNKALGTSLRSPKTIRYEGKTTGVGDGWKFIWAHADTDAVRANDTSFGFDFTAKLNGASSTAVIDGATMTFCEPLHIDCFDDDPTCLMNDGSEGPNLPYQMVNDTSIGGLAWNSPSSAMGSDNAYAGAGISTTPTNYLRATGFHFDIPTSAVIQGIVVEWEKSRMYYAPPPMPYMPNMMDGIPADNSVRLVKGGAVVGDDKAKPEGWGTTDAFASYGSATDLWGATWTPEDINSTMEALTDINFGTVLSARKLSGTYTAPTQVDSVRMTVYYKYLAGGASLYDLTINYITNLFK